jgi:hypothetical protein
MTKKEVEVLVVKDVYDSFEGKDLKDILDIVTYWINSYGENATIQGETDYNDIYRVGLYEIRLETDAEYAARLVLEAYSKVRHEEYELKELKRLQEKYGSVGTST